MRIRTENVEAYQRGGKWQYRKIETNHGIALLPRLEPPNGRSYQLGHALMRIPSPTQDILWAPFSSDMTSSSIEEYGPLLLGAMCTSFLAGVTSLQTVVYFRLYPEDSKRLKALVAVIWVLDIVHTAFTWDTVWYYLIQNFGDETKLTTIYLSFPVVGITTSIITFLTHLYFIGRIFRLSKKNYWITVPILVLAIGRQCFAFPTGSGMLHLGTFPAFNMKLGWLLTLVLSLSCAIDVLITIALFVLLRMSRQKSLSLHGVIDTLILYTLETGSLTCCAAVVAMICWLVVPNKLIFLGFYFLIAKMYSNSLLASLNTRFQLRRTSESGSSQGFQARRNPRALGIASDGDISMEHRCQHVKINVERSVQYDDKVHIMSSNGQPES